MVSTRLPDIVVGDTLKYRFIFTDQNGAAINVNGWQVWLYLKHKKNDSDGAAWYSISATGTSGSGGIIDVVVPSVQSGGFVPSSNFYHFVRVVNADRTTLAFGTARIVSA